MIGHVMCRARAGLLPLTLALLFTGCAPASVTFSSPSNVPPVALSETPAAVPPAEEELREAFRQADPFLRRESVLRAIGRVLRGAEARRMDDGELSDYLTEVAFSSGRLRLADRAFVRREGDLAVVGLPDGLGIVLYDLDASPDALPLELTSWSAGLSALEVRWGTDEFGVSFVTLGADGATRVHYLLTVRDGQGWKVAWNGDEAPDWWFNALNAGITIAPDLSRLIVEGEAESTTLAFLEEGNAPRRVFKIEWVREEDSYIPVPPVEAYPSRRAWLWAVARPSAYSTLVEFIERLQRQDVEGAADLVGSPEIIEVAQSLDLDSPLRRYQVTDQQPGSITFRDREGTYRAVFESPSPERERWLIVALEVLEGDSRTPTPETEE